MNYDELLRTTKNTKKLANPSVDLRHEKAETYSCRAAAEGRRRYLDRLRLMQRPRLQKTKCSAAAVELERQRGCERRKKDKTMRWLSDPIYKERGDRQAQKTRRPKRLLSS